LPSLTIEKIADRRLQDNAQFPKTAAADAVCAGLVFLDLLIAHAQAFAQRNLTYAQLRAPFAHASTDVNICFVIHSPSFSFYLRTSSHRRVASPFRLNRRPRISGQAGEQHPLNDRRKFFQFGPRSGCIIFCN
jgi:hypothetical protein